MRVWIYPEKVYETLGAKRWICEWYTLPENCHTTAFKTEAAAIFAARHRLNNGDDFYGNPIVRRQVVDWHVEEDRIAKWADVGEPIYIA